MANVFNAFKKIANPAVSLQAANIEAQQLIDQAKALKQQGRIQDAIQLLENASQRLDNRRIAVLLANLLMETANYQKIVALDSIRKYQPRIHALAKIMPKSELTNVQPLCLTGHQPLSDVAYVAMVKDEEDIILVNLLWHYNLGFRKFFLIDNLSSDKTGERISLFERLFSDTQVFVLHDPVVAHFQGKKTTGACRFAMTLWEGLQWLVLVDADEFLCVNQPLHSLLANISEDVDALIVPKSVYELTSDDAVDDDELFFYRMRRRRLLGHVSEKVNVSSKVIMRANMEFMVSQGNHRVLDVKGQEVSNYLGLAGLTYREFPIRSRKHFHKKIINGGRAIAAAKQQGFKDVGGIHWEAVYGLYLKEGEAGLTRIFDAKIKNSDTESYILDPLPIDAVLAQLHLSSSDVANEPDLAKLLEQPKNAIIPR